MACMWAGKKAPKRLRWQILNCFKLLPCIPAIYRLKNSARFRPSINRAIPLFGLFCAYRQGHNIRIWDDCICQFSHHKRATNWLPVYLPVNSRFCHYMSNQEPEKDASHHGNAPFYLIYYISETFTITSPRFAP